MRNITSAFKEQLNNDNRKYLEWIDITLKDGTVLNLRESDVWGYGLKVEDAVSDSSEFKIGSAIVNKATVTLNNIYDDFSNYDFEGATVVCYVGLRISPSGLEFPKDVPWLDVSGNTILDIDGNEIYIKYDDAEIERIRLCTMTVVDAPYQNSSILTLTCQDNMMKFDKDYSESKLQYPATRSEIIRDACKVCGVSLQTVTFANDDYVIQERPSDEQLTFRQVISWVAQIGGQWCRCDSYGRLSIAWYDLGSYEADTLPNGKYITIKSYDSLSVNNEDVVITGVKVTEYLEDASADKQATSYQYGTDGYVIETKDNKLIVEGTGEAIATMIGKRIVGMKFRPFSTSMMNNPAIEAGDICVISDRKGNTYRSLITSSTFQVGNKQNVECGAKSAARNSAKQYSLSSQTIAEYRKLLQKERSRREKAVKNLADRISNSAGLYTTVEQNPSGGYTYYLHNKTSLKESDIVWKMTAEAWGVSTDGGQTWNGGMTVDGDTIVRILDAIGIKANWITSGEFKVEDEDGNEVFYVNCDTGVVRIKAQSFSLTGTTIEEIANRQINKFVDSVYNADISEINGKIDSKNANYYQNTDPALAWTGTSEEAWRDVDGNAILDAEGNEILITCETEKGLHEGDKWKNTSNNEEYIYKSGNWIKICLPDSIMKQLDGKIDSYFYDYEPTTSNYPTSEWKTDEEKESHNGDLFFWKQKGGGLCYRYVQINGEWTWYNVKDPSVQKALEDASKAQDTADGKRRNFITTPIPPYDVGDLWSQGSDGDLMRCQTARASGNYNSSDWIKASKYTDDTKANKVKEELDVLGEDLQGQIDGKIDSYNQSNNPADTWTTAELKTQHKGDLWYSPKEEVTRRWNGTSWDKLSDAEAKAANNLAMSKKRVFVTTPIPPYDVGDLWVGDSTSDFKRCVTAKKNGEIYNTNDWIIAVKYTDDTAVDNLNKLLTQEEIFNRLTNNGEIQGIYSQDGQLYINFSYGKGGTLKLGGVNNENGTLEMLDASGNTVGIWNNEGLNLKKGSIYGSTIYLDENNLQSLIIGRNKDLETVYEVSCFGMTIDTTNMNMLYNVNKMFMEIDGGLFNGIRIRTAKTGKGYGAALSPGNFAVSKADDLTGWSSAMASIREHTFSVYEDVNGNMAITTNGSNYMKESTTISPIAIRTTGTKNRIVDTENYAQRLQYCYEMPSPLFGDVGEACTDDSGSCYVMLDDVFRETIADDSTYHVFITKEGQGDLWVAEKTPSYFIVQGTKNLGFAWEVKAKQKGYEMERLEICDPTATKEEAVDYEEEGFKVYTDYVEQIEVTNNIGEEN